MLKLISLWEPWNYLLSIRAKKIETRGWHTDYRGPVALHSTKGGLSRADLFDMCTREYFIGALSGLWNGTGNSVPIGTFQHGHIIAVGDLVDCLPIEATGCLPGVFDDYPKLDTPQERAFGNYDPGRFGLVFENVKILKAPVPFKSRQGRLLELDVELERQVNSELPK